MFSLQLAKSQPRVLVIQDGARLHYSVPRALQQAGLLERVYADWWVRPGSLEEVVSRVIRVFAPALGRRMADRYCCDLDSRYVKRHSILSFYHQIARRGFSSPEAFYAWSSAQVGRWVRRKGWGNANVLFGHIRNIHPHLCKMAKKQGLLTVGDQMIAPAAIELSQFHREKERWPGWMSIESTQDFGLVEDVERRTWRCLDHVTCASEYVRQGLIAQGIESARVSVIPYPIDAAKVRCPQRDLRKGPLTIGFVGAVGLRKGAPYFLEVARRLRNRSLRFVMVGPIALSTVPLREMQQSVETTGTIARSEVQTWLQNFDVFLFPSTCEGSAGAVMEAMACGLPIVTSPESGTIIEDGTEGFVCHYDDVETLTSRVALLADNASLRVSMGQAARRRAESFDLSYYGRTLSALLGEIGASGDRIPPVA